MFKYYVVIPARGGSKGVLRKNLREVGGVPLLVRAIRTAKLWGRAEKIIVSSDDGEILRLAKNEGVEISYRPPELAAEDTATADTVAHCIYNMFEEVPVDSAIVLLEPTSPFRTVDQIATCTLLYESDAYQSVVTICDLERKPENILEGLQSAEYESIEYRRLLTDERLFFSRRQDMTSLKRIAGSIYVINTAVFLRRKSFVVEPLGCVWVDQVSATNIDSVIDLVAANAIFDYCEGRKCAAP